MRGMHMCASDKCVRVGVFMFFEETLGEDETHTYTHTHIDVIDLQDFSLA